MMLVLLLSTCLFQDEDVSGLIRKLGSENLEEREKAEQQLVHMGDKAEDALREALKSEESEIIVRARRALEKIESAREEKRIEERVRALPEKLPEFRWTYFEKGVNLTTGKMKTRFESGKILMENTSADGSECVIVCTPNRFLTPEKITAKITGHDAVSYEAVLNRGKLDVIVEGGKKASLEVSNILVASSAVPRLVAVLPQKKGYRLEFDLLFESLKVSKGASLECAGEEEVMRDGQRIQSWKWIEKKGGGDVATRVWWVSDGKPLEMRYGRTDMGGTMPYGWEIEYP